MTFVLGAVTVVGFFSLLTALTRRIRSGLNLYRASGFAQGLAAVLFGLLNHDGTWVGLGLLWLVIKVVLVPFILKRTLPDHVYSMHAAGTPRLLVGAVILFAVLGWSLGPVGMALASVLLPFWLIAQRGETWVQTLLLLEGEIGVGLSLMALHGEPVLADAFAAIELLMTAALLAWLHRRQVQDFGDNVTSEMLSELRG